MLDWRDHMKLIKIKEVMRQTSLARSTIYKYISEGAFPQPVKLGVRMVAWIDSEVEDWIRDKVQSRDRDI